MFSICVIKSILLNLYIVELEGFISITRGEPQDKFINDCASIYISNINEKFMYKIIGWIQHYIIIIKMFILLNVNM